MKIMRLTALILTLAFMVLVTANAKTASKNDLVRCSEAGYVGSSMESCGGDSLTNGVIQVSASSKVSVTVSGTEADPWYPYNLYEVYWLPVDESVSAAQLSGNFVTDCNGSSIKNS